MTERHVSPLPVSVPVVVPHCYSSKIPADVGEKGGKQICSKDWTEQRKVWEVERLAKEEDSRKQQKRKII